MFPLRTRTEQRRTISVSHTLRVIAVLVLVLVAGAMAQQLVGQRAAIIEDTRAEHARLATVLAEQTGRAVEMIDMLLADIAGQRRTPGGRAGAWDTTGEEMAQRIGGIAPITGMAVVAADGTLLAATPGLASATEVTPRVASLIQRYRDDPSLGLLFSAPFATASGDQMLLLSRPLFRPDRTLDGVVVGRLDLSFFETLYKSVDLDDDGIISLHLRDGTVLVAFPHHDAAIGAGHERASDQRTQAAPSPSGGEDNATAGKRIFAVRALKTLPLAVTISVSSDSVLAPWRRGAGIVVSFGLAAAGLIGALLLLLATECRRAEVLLVENSVARARAEETNRQMAEQMEERERTEAALRQAQRLEAVGQLTGGVAHDFNNILTVLLGNIDLMEARRPGERRAPDPITTARLERMRVAAEKGATLTHQLLAFARRQPLVPRPASLNTVIKGMNDLIQSAIGGNIRFVTELAPEPWLVRVDTTQIELVILNLALNARDAMPRGGTLTLATANHRIPAEESTQDLPEGDYVIVRVSDTGSGMTDDVRAKAFEPFFTTKGPGLGSGLGLSQVYGVARQSGGSARLHSTPEQGTSVSVFLPRTLSDVVADRRGNRDAAETITQGARLLLVDDDEAVRATTTLILEAIGYVVHEAAAADVALERIVGGLQFDLLLTDVAMPGTNGAELAERVRQLRPELPIIFISGYADPDAVAGHHRLQPLVRKPFRVADLAAEIEAALAERRRAA